MPNRFKYSKETIIEAFKLRDEGLPRPEIGKRTGMDSGTLSLYFRGKAKSFNPSDYGFKPSEPQRDRVAYRELHLKYRDEYARLWKEGLTHPQIQEELGISEQERAAISSYLYFHRLIEPRTFSPSRKNTPRVRSITQEDRVDVLREVKKDDQTRIHERTIDQICDLFSQNVPFHDIVRKTGIKSAEVRRILEDEGYIK